MEKFIKEIQKCMNSCFAQLADHAMQSEVLSPQIKRINENLKKISSLLEDLNDEHTLAKKDEAKIFLTRDSITESQKQDMIKVAYALSRFDYQFFNKILQTRHNQGEMILLLADKLMIKSTTLRNYRDMFDPYVKQERSERKGRHGQELPPIFKAQQSAWDGEDENFIKAEIEKIIKNSGNPEPDNHPSYTEF
jgi:hypothetical protein